MAGWTNQWIVRWRNLGLTGRFMVTSSIPLILGMSFVGHWVASRISEGVVHSHATAAALYAHSVIESRVQELAVNPALSTEAKSGLDALLRPEGMGKPVVSFRIWKGDRVIYGSDPEDVGMDFPPSSLRARAWAGQVAAEYEEHEPGHVPVAGGDQPILEIYAPIRKSGTTEIIALAETYQLAPDLPAELLRATIGSWIVVAAFTAGLLAIQYAIVNRGSRTIDEQRSALAQRVVDLSRLLDENGGLRKKIMEANARVAESSERLLRSIGSDLHDGPVQLLGMAMLRLGSIEEHIDRPDPELDGEAREDLAVIREGLQECLLEIRNLSSGLAPPAIETLSLAEIVEAAARRHRRLTGTDVRVKVESLSVDALLPVKSCLHRFVQEGLNNAFRHGEGRGQVVEARVEHDDIVVSVADSGPGLPQLRQPQLQGGQGLPGLRDRIEAIGGEVVLERRQAGGVILRARIPLLPARILEEAHA